MLFVNNLVNGVHPLIFCDFFVHQKIVHMYRLHEEFMIIISLSTNIMNSWLYMITSFLCETHAGIAVCDGQQTA